MIRKERNAEVFYFPARDDGGDEGRVARLSLYGHRGRLATFEIGKWQGEAAEDLMRDAEKEPIPAGEAEGKLWWLYKQVLYSTGEDDLLPGDVKALIEEQENKKKLKIARAKTVAAMADNLDRKGKRESIPKEVKVAVWQRDQGICVQCGSRENLEFDHIVPVARGGSNTERNIQLLCADCNREKGASL